MARSKLRSLANNLSKAVSRGNTDKVKTIIDSYVKVHKNSDDKIRNLKALVNHKDEDGWTPLQIAANLGYNEICKFLIDNGADIDIQRENYPSPLALAASNNHSDVVKLLLENDVVISHPDSVYAAAISMNHIEVKNLIHSHMINQALDCLMKTQKSDEYELCTTLRNSLHEMLMTENRYPVRIILYLKENRTILKNIKKCINVLYALRDQQFEESKSEKLSWECHEIAHTLVIAEEHLPSLSLAGSSVSHEYILDHLIKSWLADQPKNGISQALQTDMKYMILSYLFKESNIYKTTAKRLIENFRDEFAIFETCETCRNRHDLKLCTACDNTRYCSRTCLKLHRFVHKIECVNSGSNILDMLRAIETKLSFISFEHFKRF